MSRIGKAPIPVPQGVTVTINGEEVKVKGPKGELKRVIRPELKVTQEDGKIVVARTSEERNVRSLHGMSRTLISNMVTGVTQGFTKNMEIVGVGYRAAVEGKNLVMQLGYSHPVEIPIPEGLTVTVTKNVSMSITGADKQMLGDFCSYVRDRRPPEVYKGKGVKYQGEYIRRKAGKAAGKKK
ncbi:MAG: 50S ribosomal protein L6 [Candidatus Obscuribacterales bacterium]|nr:50S ribosomal protein L6 [Candidatus Obscuribacterales bacterium]